MIEVLIVLPLFFGLMAICIFILCLGWIHLYLPRQVQEYWTCRSDTSISQEACWKYFQQASSLSITLAEAKWTPSSLRKIAAASPTRSAFQRSVQANSTPEVLLQYEVNLPGLKFIRKNKIEQEKIEFAVKVAKPSYLL